MNNISVRLQKEVGRLISKPPAGVTCYPKDGNYRHLRASLLGNYNSPYEGGIFEIDINIPSNYPFLPPRLRFLTKIYHPNIDEAGRICMDILKSEPEGIWRPTFTIEGVLVALQVLMGQPNPDNPLVASIANEYKFNKLEFDRKAKDWTIKYARINEANQLENNIELDEKN